MKQRSCLLKIVMFKFGFSDTDQASEPLGTIIEWRKCEEVVYVENSYTKDAVKDKPFKTVLYPNLILNYLSPNSIMDLLNNYEDLEESSILKAEENHSDLLPALYEGGFKVWECTFDLIKYLMGTSVTFDNKNCLDLGCGAGLLGIYSLLQGALCTFQDYNLEVIRYLTIPNVLLNLNSTVNCKFFCGDWGSFTDIINDVNEFKFDYIFTSETIYNTDNYAKLCNVFKYLLKKTGIIFLAAKSYYFGVGGGISLFQKYLDGTNIFKYETVWENNEGVKRSILKITFI